MQRKPVIFQPAKVGVRIFSNNYYLPDIPQNKLKELWQIFKVKTMNLILLPQATMEMLLVLLSGMDQETIKY